MTPVQTSGKKDLRPVKVQTVTIPIWELGDGRYAFSDHYGGVRRVRKFAREDACRVEAVKCAQRALRGESVRHDMTTRDIQAFSEMTKLAERHGLTPVLALDEWSRARELLGDRGLLDVLRSGLDAVSRPQKLFRDVVEMFLDAKRLEGVSSIYLAELTEDLTSFAKTYGERPIAGIGTEDIGGWLASRMFRGKLIGARRRNNLRGTLVTLFKFAQSRHPAPLLPPGPTAPQLIGKARDKRAGAVTVYTPAELCWLLKHVKPEYLPWIAIGAFSGVRTEEICPPPESEKDRLRWTDFHWKKSHINIRPEVSKTGERRLVPIMPNLATWLRDWADATGPVVPLGHRTDRESDRLSRVSRRLTAAMQLAPDKSHHPSPGLVWRRNALRHSYCSYRMAEIKNAPQVAYEAGNSVSMIKRHYHEAQEDDIARAWFSVIPDDAAAGNVVQFRFAI